MRCLFLTCVSALTCAAAVFLAHAVPAAADARVIHVGVTPDTILGGRIVRTFASELDADPMPRVLTRRVRTAPLPSIDVVPEVVETDEADLVTIAPATRTVRTVVVRACPFQPTRKLRAADSFRSGGNHLRLPAAEATLGRGSCTARRPMQRFVGFKKAYKGPAYLSASRYRGQRFVGFNRVYSGPRYLTGSY